MMIALRTHQSPEGLWRQLIDRPVLWLESSDSATQYQLYVRRPRSTGDLHGQAPMLWAAAALLRE